MLSSVVSRTSTVCGLLASEAGPARRSIEISSGAQEKRLASERFLHVQHACLQRHGVDARSDFLPIAGIGGDAHVLNSGEGPLWYA